MNKKKLQIEQLEERIKLFSEAQKVPNPPTGWIRAIRLALGMSLKQLAGKLSVSTQSIHEVEMREREGAVTIRSLREAANALDMDLVYGFVPKDGSLEKLIDKRAGRLAEKIVSRTSHTMSLEDQENSKSRIRKAVKERKQAIKEELPKSLWD
ncbi:MAG: mobile mystery protein A [Balneolia bacterium]|nr:mobile mystery protein A [Balneolia bacterium]